MTHQTVTSTPLEAKLATSLILLCAASTHIGRIGGFPSPDARLDNGGLRAAAAISLPSRFAEAVHCSPDRAAMETADTLRVTAAIEPALGDLDYGRWSGMTFVQVEALQPGAIDEWLKHPDSGTDGGETLETARDRIGEWLDRITSATTPICAITHPMMVRAALSHALDMPVRTTLAIDIGPLSGCTLSFNGKWRLQSLNADECRRN